jgi:adenine-specific DNA-methyltransferase
MNETNLNGESKDIVAENIEQLRALFPEVFAEESIDFKKLKAVLGEYVDDDEERYNFTWWGKSKALRLAQTPSTGTLRPCPEESKDWDSTQNLYIEGDNLEVLKLLQKTYHNKVKMIYIDPPYNTGKDFVYPDNYKDNLKNYLEITGQVTEGGQKTSTNSESSGRYHTNWLNMMFPRLRLARNLLKDDGAIFISIDDNEVANLRKVCDEIFGEENFIANIVWQKKYAATNDAKGFSVMHDHIIVYQKSKAFNRILLPRTAKQNKPYKHDDKDDKGLWRSDNLLVKSFSKSSVFPITNPNTGKEYLPPEGSSWRGSWKTIEKWLSENRIFFGMDGKGAPQLKRYLNEVQQGRVPVTWWPFQEVGHNDAANKEMKKLFGTKSPFDTPKPSTLISQILKVSAPEGALVLDFFSGSSTCAHAVMQLNTEDNGHRKFIMVQLPELTKEDSTAYKTGYENIAKIGKERIRLAGDQIKAELKEKYDAQQGQMLVADEKKVMNPDELDIGFKVFKLDSSNLKKWNPDADDLEESLFGSIENFVEGRSELDMVYEIMLKYGIDLTLAIETYTAGDKKIYSVGLGALMICLDNEITTDVAQEIVKLKAELSPEVMRVVFKDNGFKDDSSKTNAKEILRTNGVDEIVSI